MATGDILSVTIVDKTTAGLVNDGWYADIEVDGFTTGMDVDFGSGVGSDLDDADVDSANIVFTVTSDGYSTSGVLGTTVRVVKARKILRQAYPNNASENQDTTLGGARVRVILDEPIYDDDTATVTIAAGTLVNTGGSSETSTVATGASVTNNSTQDYPQVIAQWDTYAGVQTADRVVTDFIAAVDAWHKFGIACVVVTATGQTSANSETATITSRTATQRTATSLFHSAYQSELDLSGFTDDELINLDFVAYPLVGDADSIIDTSGSTDIANECLGKNRAVIVCNKDDDGDVYAFVDSAGNDGTGVASATLATAEASPYLTIGKAIQGGANRIKVNAGTFAAVGSAPSARVTTNEWVIVEPADGASPIVKLSSVRTYKCERLKYRGFTVQLTDTGSWLDGEHAENFLCFENCEFDRNGVSRPTAGAGYRSHCCYITNCTGDLGDNTWNLKSFSSSRVAYQFDGVAGATTAGNQVVDPFYRVVGCRWTGQHQFITKAATNASPVQGNLVVANNQFLDNDSTLAKTIFLADTINLTGLALVGNVIEKTAGTSPAVSIAADSTTAVTDHILLWHNTVAGDRCNLSYNDAGTTGYSHGNWSIKGNSFRDFNVKADVFGTGSGNRTGGWPVVFGVGVSANNHEISTFPAEYPGFDLTTGDPSYHDDQSFTGAGGGSGDYRPDSGTTLENRISGLLPVDLLGNDAALKMVGAHATLYNDIIDLDTLPNATIRDDFGRSNQSGGFGDAKLGGVDQGWSWPPASSCSISSNVGVVNTARTFLIVPVDTGTDQQSGSIKLVSAGTYYELGIIAQSDGGVSGWAMVLMQGQLRAYEVNGGALTLKGTSTTIDAGDLSGGVLAPNTTLTWSNPLNEGTGNHEFTLTFGSTTRTYEITTNPHDGNQFIGLWLRDVTVDDYNAGVYAAGSTGMHGGVRWIVQQRNRRRTRGGSYANLR